MKKIISALALILILMSACTGNETRLILDEVESYISERPDNALTVLRSIPAEQLKGREDNAKYALLYSMALDKNFIDVTSDSLITVAVNYYQDKSDIEKRFLSYYYCGRVQSNGGHYAKAMLSYAKAEELAGKIDDPFYLGLLYSQLGIIHEIVYDYPKSLEAYEKAYDYYCLSDSVFHQFYAKMHIGNVLLYLKNYDEAEKYLTETMHWAYDNNDYVCQSCAETLIMLYEERGDENALLSLYQSPYVMDCKDDMIMMQSLAFVHAYEGDAEKALSYMDKAWSLAKDQNDTIILKSKEYRIHKLLGNTDKALEEYEELFYLQDSIVRKTLQQPILSAQNEYFHSQAKYNELKLSHNRTVVIYIFIAIALIIGFALFFIRQRMIAKNDEINRYMEECSYLESERDSLKEVMDSSCIVDQEAQKIISARLDLLNQFFSSSIQSNSMKEQAASMEFDNLVDNTDKFLHDTRMVFTGIYPRFIDYLKGKGLTDSQLEICCLYALGLSGKDVINYTRRKRHYIENMAIRSKLGLEVHGQNLGGYIQGLLKDLK